MHEYGRILVFIFISDFVATTFTRSLLTAATLVLIPQVFCSVFQESSLVPVWVPILVQPWLLNVPTHVVNTASCCKKISGKRNVREKGCVLAQLQVIQIIMARKMWQPVQGSAGTLYQVTKKEECSVSAHFLPFMHPRTSDQSSAFRVCLLTSVNLS